MPPSRRHVLGAGLALVGSAVAERARAAPAVDGAPSEPWMARVAEDFAALDRSVVQLAGFLLAAHPRAVAEAIEAFRRALDAEPAAYLNTHNRRLERRVREEAAAFLGVRPRELALTDSTTMGLGLVYGSVALRPGKELLATTHDHHATHAALQHRAKASGAAFRRVSLYRDPREVDADAIARAIEDAIRPETRVLAITWVHSSTGVALPVRRIADTVARANVGRAEHDRVLLCVDGVHALGVKLDRPEHLGCDVLVAGTHKWLCGPRGTGFVWGNAHARAALRPIVASFSRGAGWGGRMTPGGFHSFEHRWALADAFRWFTALDPARVSSHVHALALRLKEGLARIPGVELATPLDPAHSAGIVSFDVRGLNPREAVRRLGARGVAASRAPYARAYVRLAPSVYTWPSEVDRALEAVEGIARGSA